MAVVVVAVVSISIFRARIADYLVVVVLLDLVVVR